MALRQSASLHSQTSSATGVSSAQTSPNHLHSAVTNAGIKIAGIVLLVCLCALIILSAEASGKQANDEFEAANSASGAALKLQTSATETLTTAPVVVGSVDTSVDVAPSVSNDSQSTVSVTIDGQTTEVPANTTFQKTTTSADGTTTVTSTTTQGGSSNSSYTSTNLNISNNSSSYSSGGGTVHN